MKSHHSRRLRAGRLETRFELESLRRHGRAKLLVNSTMEVTFQPVLSLCLFSSSKNPTLQWIKCCKVEEKPRREAVRDLSQPTLSKGVNGVVCNAQENARRLAMHIYS